MQIASGISSARRVSSGSPLIASRHAARCREARDGSPACSAEAVTRAAALTDVRTFRREYDKAAQSVDAELAGTAPSRAHFCRWLCGELSGLPYPYHCRVLEKLFPGWTAAQLFEHWDQQADSTESGPAEIAQLFNLIATGLSEPGLAPAEWAESGTPDGAVHARPADHPETGRDLLPAAVSSHAAPGVSTATRELVS